MANCSETNLRNLNPNATVPYKEFLEAICCLQEDITTINNILMGSGIDTFMTAVDNGDNTYTFTNVSGTVVTIDLNPFIINVTQTAGNWIFTKNDGSTITIYGNDSGIRTETANYPVVVTDGTIIANVGCDLVTLPNASLRIGQKITILENDATVFVAVSGNGNNINGSAVNFTYSALHEVHTFQWDGTEWFIIN